MLAPLFRPEHFAYDVATTLPSTEEHASFYLDDVDEAIERPTGTGPRAVRPPATLGMPGVAGQQRASNPSYGARTHKLMQLHHKRPTVRVSATHTTVNVVAMVGFPPASGKSTFFEKLASRCATRATAACSIISAKPNGVDGSLRGR